MHIAINALSFRPGAVGGVDVYVREILGGLRRAGARLTAYCWAGAAECLADLGADPVPLFAGGYSQWQRAVAEIARVPIRVHRIRAEVLFSPANSCAPMAFDVPQVATVHDLQHVALPENFSRSQRTYRSLMFWLDARMCARLITPSEYTRRDVIKVYRARPDRVVAIPLGATLRANEDRAFVERVKASHRLPPMFVFYPAVMWPHKNHAMLFRAVARAREMSGRDLRIVLSGARNVRSAYMSRDTLPAFAQDLGYLPHAEVGAVMRCSAAVVFPSLFEGFGLPVLEAMMRGVRVISSDAASLPEVVGDGGRLVDPYDVEAWARELVALTAERAPGDDEATRAVAQAARFSWDVCVRETAKVLESAAASVVVPAGR